MWCMQEQEGIVTRRKVSKAIVSSWSVDGVQVTLIKCLKKAKHLSMYMVCYGVTHMETVDM